jgi:hypothetical protein
MEVCVYIHKMYLYIMYIKREFFSSENRGICHMIGSLEKYFNGNKEMKSFIK